MGCHRPQSNQLFTLALMLSSRLNRQSKTVAPSLVSRVAWRGCIDNTPAGKVQSIPWGAQQRVYEDSPDGLLALYLDIAAENRSEHDRSQATQACNKHTHTHTLVHANRNTG